MRDVSLSGRYSPVLSLEELLHDECCMMCVIKSQQTTAAGTSKFLSLSHGDRRNRMFLGSSHQPLSLRVQSIQHSFFFLHLNWPPRLACLASLHSNNLFDLQMTSLSQENISINCVPLWSSLWHCFLWNLQTRSGGCVQNWVVFFLSFASKTKKKDTFSLAHWCLVCLPSAYNDCHQSAGLDQRAMTTDCWRYLICSAINSNLALDSKSNNTVRQYIWSFFLFIWVSDRQGVCPEKFWSTDK